MVYDSIVDFLVDTKTIQEIDEWLIKIYNHFSEESFNMFYVIAEKAIKRILNEDPEKAGVMGYRFF